MILVSHDRDFLQGLSNKVFEFKNKVIKEYLGDIDYYLEQHNLDNLREIEKRTVVKSEVVNSSGKDAYLENKQKERVLKQLKNSLSKCEKSITILENEIFNMDAEIYENSEEVTANLEFFKKYQEKKDQLDVFMEEWSELHEKLEGCS